MKSLRKGITLFAFLILTACSAAPAATPTLTPTSTAVEEEHPEWSAYFEPYGADGAFILLDVDQNRTLIYNPEQCEQEFLPASTFKILNSLIALETGVLQGPDTVIEWDGTNYGVPAWNKDQTMQSAFQNSVVWYYQEVARRIGAEQMQQYVEQVGYGNSDISGNLDSFWLDGALRITARQQVDFIQRLIDNDLPFSAANQQTVRDLMIVEQTGAYTLHAKTGLVVRTAVATGWYVGYVEREGKVYIFALNMTGGDTDAFAEGRATITRQILQEQGLVD